jgi:hypothetical protein
MKKSADFIRFQGTVESRGEASALLKAPGDAVLIERGRPRLLLLSCPCGCGEHFPINLDPRAGPAWRLYGNGQRGLSLYPSVWRESDCRSHYVIWRNKIFLFGRYEDDLDASSQPDETIPLIDVVRDHLPTKGLIPFFEIAEAVGAIPWDVLMVCRRLVKSGRAREGSGKRRGSFGRK